MAKNIQELTRVNMNLPTSIVERVKTYADDLGLNVTSAYIVLLNQALEQKDMVSKLPLMLSMMNDLKNINIEKNETSLLTQSEK